MQRVFPFPCAGLWIPKWFPDALAPVPALSAVVWNPVLFFPERYGIPDPGVPVFHRPFSFPYFSIRIRTLLNDSS